MRMSLRLKHLINHLIKNFKKIYNNKFSERQKKFPENANVEKSHQTEQSLSC